MRERLAAYLDEVSRVVGRPVRVALDDLSGSGAGELADDLVDPLGEHGREALRVSAEDFVRPASLRLERGPDDPDAYYEDRYDLGTLRREVLDPLASSGVHVALTPEARRRRVPAPLAHPVLGAA